MSCPNCNGTGRRILSTSAAGENVHSDYLDCAAPGCAAAADMVKFHEWKERNIVSIGTDEDDDAIYLRGRHDEREATAARIAHLTHERDLAWRAAVDLGLALDSHKAALRTLKVALEDCKGFTGWQDREIDAVLAAPLPPAAAQAAPVVAASELSDEQITALAAESGLHTGDAMQFTFAPGRIHAFARAVLAAATPAASVADEPSDDYKRGWEDGMKECAGLLAMPEKPYAWTRKGFICDDQGYAIGCDEPEFHIGAECPDDDGEGAWEPLYFSAPAVQQPAEGGWKRNEGYQPVADDVKVDVELGNGRIHSGDPAAEWCWDFVDDLPIVYWRPAAPTQAEGQSHD